MLAKFPLITKNKLNSTNIERTITNLSLKNDTAISLPAKELLDSWQALELGYRIPKSMKEALEGGDEKRKRDAEIAMESLYSKRVRTHTYDEHIVDFVKPEAYVRPLRAPSSTIVKPSSLPAPPPGWQLIPPSTADGRPSYLCTLTKTTYNTFPTPDIVKAEQERHQKASFINVNDIIAQAKAEAEAKAAIESANLRALEEEKRKENLRKSAAKEKKSVDDKERKLYKLFSTVVVRTMSRYKKHLDQEQFKRRAKEVTEIMCDKEKKGSGYATEKYDSLNPDKEAKLKKYVKDFITKVSSPYICLPQEFTDADCIFYSFLRGKESSYLLLLLLRHPPRPGQRKRTATDHLHPLNNIH